MTLYEKWSYDLEMARLQFRDQENKFESYQIGICTHGYKLFEEEQREVLLNILYADFVRHMLFAPPAYVAHLFNSSDENLIAYAREIRHAVDGREQDFQLDEEMLTRAAKDEAFESIKNIFLENIKPKAQ